MRGAKWKCRVYPVLCVIVYMPFHIIEEALGNFPLWMHAHYGMPKILSYPHWLINNGIFFLVLVLGLLIYLIDEKKYLPFGVGILVWSLMNGMEHVVFSVIDRKAAPGWLTALVFFLVVGVGLVKLRREGFLDAKLVAKSTLVAIVYWAVSFGIIVLIGGCLSEMFP